MKFCHTENTPSNDVSCSNVHAYGRVIKIDLTLLQNFHDIVRDKQKMVVVSNDACHWLGMPFDPLLHSLQGMSEIAIREKMNRTEQDGTRLNSNSIGLENTVDYRS